MERKAASIKNFARRKGYSAQSEINNKPDAIKRSKLSDLSNIDAGQQVLPKFGQSTALGKAFLIEKKLENATSAESANDNVTAEKNDEMEVDQVSLPDENSETSADYDYDAMQDFDPYQVSLYARDIFSYQKAFEDRYRLYDYTSYLDPALLRKFKMKRAEVVNWYVQMQEDLELNHESLYHAVKLFDMYFARKFPTADEWSNGLHQLQAAGALLIAIKHDNQVCPSVEELDILPFGESSEGIKEAECKILNVLDGELNIPLSYSFLRRYAKVIGMDLPPLTLARYYLETSLYFPEFMPAPESLVAAAALMLALKVLKFGEWGSSLVKYTGYKPKDVEPLMWSLNHVMHMRPKTYPSYTAVFEKYSHTTFFCVAKENLLPDKLIGQPVELPANLRIPRPMPKVSKESR